MTCWSGSVWLPGNERMAGPAKKEREDMYLHELQVFHWAFCIQAAAEIVGANMKTFGLEGEISPEAGRKGNLTYEDVSRRVVKLARGINFATRPLGDVPGDCACGESVEQTKE